MCFQIRVYTSNEVMLSWQLMDTCDCESMSPQNLTLHRARVAGLQTARLPITRFMEFAPSSPPHNRNLPINIGTVYPLTPLISSMRNAFTPPWGNLLESGRFFPSEKFL